MLSGKNSSLSEGMDLIMGALLRLDLEVVLQFPKKKKKIQPNPLPLQAWTQKGALQCPFEVSIFMQIYRNLSASTVTVQPP
jgi:hypothetical protein